jgi:predicted dithiol-disulfide oxidoreductase (DUF899 family)
MPGVSTFYKGADGEVIHAYSSYGRGIDILNTAYNYLDLVPRDATNRGCRRRWPGCAATTSRTLARSSL